MLFPTRGGGGGGSRARSLYATPSPPPRVLRDSGLGIAPTAPPIFFCMAPTAPPFFYVCFLFIKPSMLLSARYRKTRRYTNVVCCEVLSAEMSKTGRYTNVVCCELKILHSEQTPARV